MLKNLFKVKKTDQNTNQQTSFIRGYKQFWPFLKPCWILGVFGMLLTIPVGALDAVIASFLKPFIDNVMIAQEKSFANFVPVIIIGFTLIQGLFIYFSAIVNNYVGTKISLSIKTALYKKLLYLDTNYFDHNSTGNIIFRFYNDADLAANGLISNIKLFLTRFFSSISLVCVLFYNSWQLAFVALGVVTLIIIPLTLVKKSIKRIMNQTVTGMAELYTHYNETYAGIRIVKAFGLNKYMENNFNYKATSLFALGMRMIRDTNWLSPILNLISATGVAGVLYFGISLIIDGTITSGAFVAFIASLMMLYSPLKTIGNNYINVQNSLLALDRIYEILNLKSYEEENIKDKEKLTSIKHSIEFKNVYFSYDENKEILKGISFKVPVGKKIALVGNSGGGKTTVCALIPRLYNIQKGSILIDGKDIKDFSLSSLRKNIAIVFQDNFLFQGTIKENLTCVRNNITEQEIQEAISNACLKDFIDSLPKGINTQIGERGVSLSGGQKQRLAIARAILKNSSLVILDEATSALDNKSEKIVQKALDNLMKGRTTIVIAHRLSTIVDSDEIIVLNNGIISEKGNHHTLLNNHGEYSSFYLSQFKKV